MTTERLKGNCPMGCGTTLFLGDDGYVACSHIACPCPTAVADILEDRETEHIVVTDAETFTIAHPLRERLNGDLSNCGLHAFLAALSGPPSKPGRYRVFHVEHDDSCSWQFYEMPSTVHRSIGKVDETRWGDCVVCGEAWPCARSM